MRRLTRTRRLSIAAIVSSLAFGAVLGSGVRSFQFLDNMSLGKHQLIALNCGCVVYLHESKDNEYHCPLLFHKSLLVETNAQNLHASIPATWSFAGFWGGHLEGDQTYRFHEVYFGMPIWTLLPLLLITPVRWLIARPANVPAFPVVTDAKPSL